MKNILQPKQVIKDYCRQKKLALPLYYLVEEEKIDLHKYYTVQVSFGGEPIAQGKGLSRRIAEFKAALNAIHLISQNDSSILELVNKTDKHGRPVFGRSLSVDQIARSNRFGSFSSIIPERCPSASPSIDNIDSLTENSDYSSVTSNNGRNSETFKKTLENLNDEETSSESLDEGVYVESSESSSSVSSPKLTNKELKQAKSFYSVQKEDDIKQIKKKSKPSFLKSFFLLSSLREFSRRSLRPKSFKKNQLEQEFDKNADFSNESLLKHAKIFSASESKHNETECSPVNNGFTNLITESILEEEEENDSLEYKENSNNEVSKNSLKTIFLNDLSRTQCSLPRNISVFHSSNNLCSHNHFSIYGPMLCQNSLKDEIKPLTIESTPSALLLRYCVRMLLPLPYYDIRFDQKFWVTCRVLFSTSKVNIKKLPVALEEVFFDREFTARGNGDTLKIARNMAAQSIIDKLIKLNLYLK